MTHSSESERSAGPGDDPPPFAQSAKPGRIRRGRVLRDTAVGDGLVFVDGDTYPFQLERLWRSEIAPRVNMAVDVEFGSDARIDSIRAVPGAQLFGDQTAQALGAAQSAARKAVSEFNQRGAPVLQQALRRVGATKLIAVCALALGWFSLHLLVISLGDMGKLSLTFYDVLGILNSGILGGDLRTLLLAQSSNPLAEQAAGLYGFAASAAVFLPLSTPFLKDRRLQLLDAAPLLVLGVAGAIACSQVTTAIHTAQAALGALGVGSSAETQQLEQQVRHSIAGAVSVGLGAYISALSCVYLAACGYLRFRKGAGRETR